MFVKVIDHNMRVRFFFGGGDTVYVCRLLHVTNVHVIQY